tara:strand:+ start:1222 stop:1911 length:690 start_codon:yes stop_codon:yes gene_type:complete
MTSKYIEEDIHTAILKLEDNSYDLIYSSPPYATTSAKWDQSLKWDMLFDELWRVLKDDGILVLHSSMPFTYHLCRHQIPKYHYTWKKNTSTNFFKAKLQPLRNIEEVLIFYKKSGTYNPQMIGDEVIKKGYYKDTSKNSYLGKRSNITKSHTSASETHTGKYPTTFLEYNIRKDGTGINRPNEMMDYFIKTYSNEGDKVLDISCHNSYCGDRCILLNREYLGIDIKLCL